jgi:hypothetical protein
MCRRCFGPLVLGQIRQQSFGGGNALRISGRPRLIWFCQALVLSLHGGLGQLQEHLLDRDGYAGWLMPHERAFWGTSYGLVRTLLAFRRIVSVSEMRTVRITGKGEAIAVAARVDPASFGPGT